MIINRKKFPVDYPKEVLKKIKLINFSESEAVTPFGSYSYNLKYPADIDLYEDFKACCTIHDAIFQFAKKVRQIAHMFKDMPQREHDYLIEFKIGVDERYNINVGTLREGVYHVNPALMDRLQGLRNVNLINDDEFFSIRNILNNPDFIYKNGLNSTAYDIIYNVLRERKILRWNLSELLQGFKILPRNVKITIEEALLSKSDIKIDTISQINNIFVEVTNFIRLSYATKENDPGYVINFGFINTKGTISERFEESAKRQVEKLFYSNIFFSPFKGAKRIFSLAQHLNDNVMLEQIVPLLDSDIGNLYQMKSQLATIYMLIKKIPNPPYKEIFHEINFIKSKLIYLPNVAEEEIGKISSLIDDVNIQNLSDVLENVMEIMTGIIDSEAMNYLREKEIFPISCDYLPPILSYIESCQLPHGMQQLVTSEEIYKTIVMPRVIDRKKQEIIDEFIEESPEPPIIIPEVPIIPIQPNEPIQPIQPIQPTPIPPTPDQPIIPVPPPTPSSNWARWFKWGSILIPVGIYVANQVVKTLGYEGLGDMVATKVANLFGYKTVGEFIVKGVAPNLYTGLSKVIGLKKKHPQPENEFELLSEYPELGEEDYNETIDILFKEKPKVNLNMIEEEPYVYNTPTQFLSQDEYNKITVPGYKTQEELKDEEDRRIIARVRKEEEERFMEAEERLKREHEEFERIQNMIQLEDFDSQYEYDEIRRTKHFGQKHLDEKIKYFMENQWDMTEKEYNAYLYQIKELEDLIKDAKETGDIIYNDEQPQNSHQRQEFLSDLYRQNLQQDKIIHDKLVEEEKIMKEKIKERASVLEDEMTMDFFRQASRKPIKNTPLYQMKVLEDLKKLQNYQSEFDEWEEENAKINRETDPQKKMMMQEELIERIEKGNRDVEIGYKNLKEQALSKEAREEQQFKIMMQEALSKEEQQLNLTEEQMKQLEKINKEQIEENIRNVLEQETLEDYQKRINQEEQEEYLRLFDEEIQNEEDYQRRIDEREELLRIRKEKAEAEEKYRLDYIKQHGESPYPSAFDLAMRPQTHEERYLMLEEEKQKKHESIIRMYQQEQEEKRLQNEILEKERMRKEELDREEEEAQNLFLEKEEEEEISSYNPQEFMSSQEYKQKILENERQKLENLEVIYDYPLSFEERQLLDLYPQLGEAKIRSEINNIINNPEEFLFMDPNEPFTNDLFLSLSPQIQNRISFLHDQRLKRLGTITENLSDNLSDIDLGQIEDIGELFIGEPQFIGEPLEAPLPRPFVYREEELPRENLTPYIPAIRYINRATLEKLDLKTLNSLKNALEKKKDFSIMSLINSIMSTKIKQLHGLGYERKRKRKVQKRIRRRYY